MKNLKNQPFLRERKYSSCLGLYSIEYEGIKFVKRLTQWLSSTFLRESVWNLMAQLKNGLFVFCCVHVRVYSVSFCDFEK